MRPLTGLDRATPPGRMRGDRFFGAVDRAVDRALFLLVLMAVAALAFGVVEPLIRGFAQALQAGVVR